MKPSRTWGGPGSGTPCSVCGEPVTQAEMELEIEYRRNGATPGPDNYYLHIRCFAVWACEIAHLANGTISSNVAPDLIPLSTAPSVEGGIIGVSRPDLTATIGDGSMLARGPGSTAKP